MQRRHLLSLLGGAAVLVPGKVWAQQASIPLIGLLNGVSSTGFAARLQAFSDGPPGLLAIADEVIE